MGFAQGSKLAQQFFYGIMSTLLQHLKLAVRDNFASAMFLFVVGTIAFVFIGYLFIDWLRTRALTARLRHRHHHSHPEHEAGQK